MCPHRELAVGWAMHCLEPDEERLFAQHLSGCAECRRTVAHAEEVGAAMALAVPQAEPSAELEQRVLSAVRSPVGSGAGQHSRAPRRHSRRSGRRPGGVLLAAAAGVVLVAVSAVLGGWIVQLDAERDRLAERADFMSRVMERVARPGTTSTALVGEDGQLRAVLIAAEGRVTLVPVQLAPIDADSQSYVLWGLRPDGPVALDAFDVARDPPALRTVSSVPQAEVFTGFAISLEPGNKLPAKPSDIVASGQVAS